MADEAISAVLARLDERTDNMQNTSREIKMWMRDHEIKDDTRFTTVHSKIGDNSKYIYIAIGAVMVLNIVIGFWVKFL